MALPRLPLAAACLLAAAFLLSPRLEAQGASKPGLPASGSGGGFTWRLETTPARAAPGGRIFAELRIEGLSEAEVVAQGFSRGLSSESVLVRPFRERTGGVETDGTIVRLELLVGKSGPWRIESLVLSGAEGRFSLPAVDLDVSVTGASSGSGPAVAAWTWSAPARVYRYEAFAVSIEGPGPGAVAIFQAPTGAAMETLPGSFLSWTVTALEPGSLVLPDATIDSGGRAARIPARKVEVLPLPRGLEKSRAMGEFALEASGPESARSGDPLTLRFVVSGRGNLPSILFPAVKARLDGKVLPDSGLSLRRFDEVRPAGSGYEGRSILEIGLLAQKGLLSVEFAPFAVLEPGGSITELTVPPVAIAVSKARQDAPSADPFAAFAAASPAKGGGDPDESVLRKLAGLWRSGKRGEALSGVYGLARRSPSDPRLSRLADAAEAAVQAGPRLKDSLPPPEPFAAGAVAGLVAALVLGFLSLRRKRPGPERRQRRRREARLELRLASPGLAAAACLVLALAIASAALCLSSTRERRQEYAVAWADRAFAVPSPLSENSIPVTRGQCGKVVGRSERYVCLRFQDGEVAWLPADGVYSY